MSALVSHASVTLCLSLMLVLPVSANPAQDARKAIRAAYAGMDKATRDRSASGYSAYLSPNCVGVDEKGMETDGRARMVQALSQAFAQVNAAKSTTQILALSLQDGGAVVTAHSDLTLSGTKNSRPFVIRSESRVRDFWIKSGGRWLLRRERVLSVTQTVNGQTVPSTS